MKSLATALRELVRFGGRQVNRFRLLLDRRKLARLETALGLLGWQQADYDERTQEHVNRLADCEREQLRLTNDSAALALEMQQIEEHRGVTEREFAEAQAVALEKEHPAAATVEALAEQGAAKRSERQTIEARLPVLDRELARAEARYRGLVSKEARPAEVTSELARLRKTILALPREKAEWQAKIDEADLQLAAMDALLASAAAARVAFEVRDREWLAEIEARERAKRKIEKQIDILEKAKTDPYREIGRALAEHGIAPLNQPEALVAVLTQRRRIAARESAIAATLAAREREGGSANVLSWLLVSAIVERLAIAGQ